MYVCQSVCLLTSIPKWDKGISSVLDDISIWNFLRHYLDVCSQLPNDSEYLVCFSVCWLATSLIELGHYRDIFSSGWYIFLKIFGDFPWQVWHFSDNFSFTIVPGTRFRPWTLYQLWTPWCTHFGSASERHLIQNWRYPPICLILVRK